MRRVRIAYRSQQAIESEPPKPVERPAGDRSVPMPPHAAASSEKEPEPLPHVVVDLGELPGGVPGPKVVPPAPQHGIQSAIKTRTSFTPLRRASVSSRMRAR